MQSVRFGGGAFGFELPNIRFMMGMIKQNNWKSGKKLRQVSDTVQSRHKHPEKTYRWRQRVTWHELARLRHRDRIAFFLYWWLFWVFVFVFICVVHLCLHLFKRYTKNTIKWVIMVNLPVSRRTIFCTNTLWWRRTNPQIEECVEFFFQHVHDFKLSLKFLLVLY